MSKIKIGQNDQAITKYKNTLKKSIGAGEEILELYNNIKLDRKLDAKSFKELLSNPSLFISKEIDAIEVPEINGRKLNKASYLSLIGFNGANSVQSSITLLAEKIASSNGLNSIKYSSLKVSENKTETDRFIESNTIYAETDEEIIAYEALTGLRESMIKLQKAMTNRGGGTLNLNTFKLRKYLAIQDNQPVTNLQHYLNLTRKFN